MQSVAPGRAGVATRQVRSAGATATVVATMGVLVGLAGIEHGVGELLQGWVPPQGVVIESWPDAAALEVVQGEPAMTLVPNLVVTGVLAVVVALALAAWSVGFAHRRHGGLVLVLLSVLLLLVGGGFGPPLIGIIIGVAATRIGAVGRRRPGRVSRALAPAWPWLLGLTVAAYLALVPGLVLLAHPLGVDSAGLVAGLSAAAFGGLFLTLVAARAHDRTR